jgi:hypothetical protein
MALDAALQHKLYKLGISYGTELKKIYAQDDVLGSLNEFVINNPDLSQTAAKAFKYGAIAGALYGAYKGYKQANNKDKKKKSTKDSLLPENSFLLKGAYNVGKLVGEFKEPVTSFASEFLEEYPRTPEVLGLAGAGYGAYKLLKGGYNLMKNRGNNDKKNSKKKSSR